MLSSIPLRSSSSQRRFRVFFAGGGIDRDEAWTALGGDVGRWKRGGDVYVEASVWVLDIQIAFFYNVFRLPTITPPHPCTYR